MTENAIFLSIRPQYVKKIFDGIKTIELRRVRPKHMKKGTLVLIYVTSPIKSLVGAFVVEKVIKAKGEELWEIVKDKAGISKEEYNDYFQGVSSGIGIFFSQIWELSEPVGLHNLQQQMLGFHPPQGFRYISPNELSSSALIGIFEENQIPMHSE
jgi:predicted transcriptional regulator